MGGTFNPIHYGHLRSAMEIREMFNLDRVLFIAAARPPHKNPSPLIPFKDRHTMITLALREEPSFEASDMEYIRPGQSYSIETLKELREEYGRSARFYFILGTDAFREITTWKNYEQLFQHTSFVVLNRPGFEYESLESFIRQTVSSDYSFSQTENAYIHPLLMPIYYCKTTLLDISSTKIREDVKARRSIRFLLPPSVEKYILEKGLYRK